MVTRTNGWRRNQSGVHSFTTQNSAGSIGKKDSTTILPSSIRVEGIIESMKGPQAGIVKIGHAVRAFFVPGTEFWESQHLNAVVNFYLGFAYGGLRAWKLVAGRINSSVVINQTKMPSDGKEHLGLSAQRSASSIDRVPHKVPLRHEITVANFQESAKPGKPKQGADRSIYVGNIPFQARKEDLAELFARFGPFTQVTIPIDSVSGLVRGFAFVEFSMGESAKAALRFDGDLSLGGRSLHLDPSQRN